MSQLSNSTSIRGCWLFGFDKDLSGYIFNTSSPVSYPLITNELLSTATISALPNIILLINSLLPRQDSFAGASESQSRAIESIAFQAFLVVFARDAISIAAPPVAHLGAGGQALRSGHPNTRAQRLPLSLPPPCCTPHPRGPNLQQHQQLTTDNSV